MKMDILSGQVQSTSFVNLELFWCGWMNAELPQLQRNCWRSQGIYNKLIFCSFHLLTISWKRHTED
jgi:hypothetical protein